MTMDKLMTYKGAVVVASGILALWIPIIFIAAPIRIENGPTGDTCAVQHVARAAGSPARVECDDGVTLTDLTVTTQYLAERSLENPIFETETPADRSNYPWNHKSRLNGIILHSTEETEAELRTNLLSALSEVKFSSLLKLVKEAVVFGCMFTSIWNRDTSGGASTTEKSSPPSFVIHSTACASDDLKITTVDECRNARVALGLSEWSRFGDFVENGGGDAGCAVTKDADDNPDNVEFKPAGDVYGHICYASKKHASWKKTCEAHPNMQKMFEWLSSYLFVAAAKGVADKGFEGRLSHQKEIVALVNDLIFAMEGNAYFNEPSRAFIDLMGMSFALASPNFQFKTFAVPSDDLFIAPFHTGTEVYASDTYSCSEPLGIQNDLADYFSFLMGNTCSSALENRCAFDRAQYVVLTVFSLLAFFVLAAMLWHSNGSDNDFHGAGRAFVAVVAVLIIVVVSISTAQTVRSVTQPFAEAGTNEERALTYAMKGLDAINVPLVPGLSSEMASSLANTEWSLQSQSMYGDPPSILALLRLGTHTLDEQHECGMEWSNTVISFINGVTGGPVALKYAFEADKFDKTGATGTESWLALLIARLVNALEYNVHYTEFFYLRIFTILPALILFIMVGGFSLMPSVYAGVNTKDGEISI